MIEEAIEDLLDDLEGPPMRGPGPRGPRGPKRGGRKPWMNGPEDDDDDEDDFVPWNTLPEPIGPDFFGPGPDEFDGPELPPMPEDELMPPMPEDVPEVAAYGRGYGRYGGYGRRLEKVEEEAAKEAAKEDLTQ